VEYILPESDKPNREIEKAWAKESIKRRKEMRSGKMKVFSFEEVMEKYLK
jgi:hypothetical protein